jgi:RNA polymerase primary sigma factor
MYDVLLNMETPSPDRGLLNSSLQKEIERSLATLGEREAEILRYYFGLNGTRPHTLEEIGEVFGLTRERVRQIKEKAIKKLKNNYRNKLLKSYLGE